MDAVKRELLVKAARDFWLNEWDDDEDSIDDDWVNWYVETAGKMWDYRAVFGNNVQFFWDIFEDWEGLDDSEKREFGRTLDWGITNGEPLAPEFALWFVEQGQRGRIYGLFTEAWRAFIDERNPPKKASPPVKALIEVKPGADVPDDFELRITES